MSKLVRDSFNKKHGMPITKVMGTICYKLKSLV